MSHKKFWKLSWYEINLYVDGYVHMQEEKKFLEEAHWARWRVMVADFRNANRKKGTRTTDPKDLIHLDIDDVKAANPSMKKPSLKDARRLLGSKFNLN